jgi:hypothetical protein
MIVNAAMLPFSVLKKAPNQIPTELNAHASARHSRVQDQSRIERITE